MIRVHILVEGDTEESFVNRILAPHFARTNIVTTVNRVTTKTDYRSGRVYRGGLSTFGKVENELTKLLNEDDSRYVTTMFDLYAIPNDFPHYSIAMNEQNGSAKAITIERGLISHFDNRRFIPYIQTHEFESLLFSDVNRIDDCLNILHEVSNSNLQQVRDEFNTPEDINDNPDTAPSKRIKNMYEGYDKVTDGVMIAEDIGIEGMRNECQHFNDWVTEIENLKPIS
ncbi:DUF4276 family protein [Aliifodinibius salicampi]|uniref:DUF4276 family protein n=1 Tax=Fodinibius salicampi TaxID=1920655 RepID=A0ABT3PZT9_9BACT|nr:DUF4276 family protein [Fodinibius salicampi]MCW9713365.1 DUF4276 family protein [Fodinibius salicampi]